MYSYCWLQPVLLKQSKCSCKRKIVFSVLQGGSLGRRAGCNRHMPLGMGAGQHGGSLVAPFLIQRSGEAASLEEKVALAWQLVLCGLGAIAAWPWGSLGSEAGPDSPATWCVWHPLGNDYTVSPKATRDQLCPSRHQTSHPVSAVVLFPITMSHLGERK